MRKYDYEYLKEINEKVKKALKTSRYIHTQGVRYTAAAMAMKFGEDISKAELAGILHDCAKNMDADKMIRICKKNKIELSQAELDNHQLLHTKAGYCVAKNKYEVYDEDILSAIRFHTTGTSDMTLLEKIIFIADFIEPGRCKAPCLDKARKAAFEDIDECMYIILKDTLDYLSSDSKPVDETTRIAYEFYKDIHEKRSGK